MCSTEPYRPPTCTQCSGPNCYLRSERRQYSCSHVVKTNLLKRKFGKSNVSYIRFSLQKVAYFYCSMQITHIHTHSRTHAHTHAFTRTHARTRAHTHAYTYTQTHTRAHLIISNITFCVYSRLNWSIINVFVTFQTESCIKGWVFWKQVRSWLL